SVKKIAPGNPIEFTLKSAILPDFTLPDFESITKDVLKSKRAVAVEDKEIEDTLQWIRNSRGKEVPAERPASKGDPVEIDFRATADGQVLERGSSQNHPLVIGEGKFVAGFEDQLIGMSQGEEKSFNLVMPSDYHEPTLAGKVVDFRAKMNDVKERQLPELNDEFAKSVGNFPSLDALRANIRDGIRQEKEHRERERIRIAIADGLAAKTEAAIPQALIESELEKMILELRERIEEMNMKFEDYLTHLKKTETDLRKEWESDAKRRVKIALILGSIAEAKSIVPSEAEVEIEANRVLTKYPTPEDAAKALDSKALRTYARSAAKNEKVFQYLESLGEK
ncbi:MAG: trigger factor, partial [Candidatus Sungbacteria bacterium]|nr:trigger factor [Candidatus Sungbacteria bacterium]